MAVIKISKPLIAETPTLLDRIEGSFHSFQEVTPLWHSREISFQPRNFRVIGRGVPADDSDEAQIIKMGGAERLTFGHGPCWSIGKDF